MKVTKFGNIIRNGDKFDLSGFSFDCEGRSGPFSSGEIVNAIATFMIENHPDDVLFDSSGERVSAIAPDSDEAVESHCTESGKRFSQLYVNSDEVVGTYQNATGGESPIISLGCADEYRTKHINTQASALISTSDDLVMNFIQPVYGWIKCSERLPEVGIVVWAFGKSEIGKASYYGVDPLYGDKHVWTGIDDVTHWQPLPAAPQQEVSK